MSTERLGFGFEEGEGLHWFGVSFEDREKTLWYVSK